jgi:Cyclophilin type peptidyl-prolyl cis-trans isomerase/CLD
LLRARRIKYYNDVLFHNVQKGFIAQTGDPTGSGTGGTSIYGCAAHGSAQRVKSLPGFVAPRQLRWGRSVLTSVTGHERSDGMRANTPLAAAG